MGPRKRKARKVVEQKTSSASSHGDLSKAQSALRFLEQQGSSFPDQKRVRVAVKVGDQTDWELEVGKEEQEMDGPSVQEDVEERKDNASKTHTGDDTDFSNQEKNEKGFSTESNDQTESIEASVE